jgi:hypothetical protein
MHFATERDNVAMQLESSQKTQFTIRLTIINEREYKTNEFLNTRDSASDGSIVLRLVGAKVMNFAAL